MKQRTDLQAALSRQAFPDFTLCGAREGLALRGLSLLARVVFAELLALADHATGAIRTSYAVLASLIAIDPPARGPRPPQITVDQLRDALAELRARGLVRLDPTKNEKAQQLILRIEARKSATTPREKLPRELARVPKSEKQANMRPSGERAPETRQGTRQGVQENPRGISRGSWGATCPQPVAIGDVLAGAKNPVPPKGHDTRAAAPRTPPGGPSRYVLAARAKLKDKPPSA